MTKEAFETIAAGLIDMVTGPHAADLERLWDALSWLETYDPVAVADMEGEFGFDVHTRTVDPKNPQDAHRD